MFSERQSEMQGVVFMPQNPQQGLAPPNNTLLVTDITMEVSPEPNQMTKDKLIINQSNQSDSGIFSATNNSAMDISTHTTNSENCDTDNRSDCSSPERKYVCPICETMLTSQHEFTLHIRSHNNESELHQDTEKGFTCRICHKVLSSSSSLDRHVLVHSGERPFHCKYCGDTFTTNGNMHRHMRTHSSHNKNENYESDGSSDSGTSTSSKSIIEYNNNQIESKLGNKRKLLDQEVDDGKSKRLTDGSSDDDSQQSYKCPVCERNDFDSIIVLETHLKDNHPDYPAKCNLCHQIFQNNKLLMAHCNAVHENNATKHHVMGFKDLTFVDFSSEKFPHIARYECEKNLHKVSSGLKFQCGKCSRAFPCSSSLEIHEKECINSNGLDLSSKTTQMSENAIRRNEFFSRLNLQDNSPEKLLPQHTEASTKLRQQLLAKAMSVESKDLADIQSIISITSSGSLLQQLQSKSEPKSESPHQESSRQEPEEELQDLFAVEFRKMKLRGEFPCRLCSAIFPNLRALKGHNRAHLNGNNNGTYRCNMCPHSSMDKAALIRHMRTHNGDRPYECSLCNYAFTTKANCERHLRNRHAKTTREEVKKAIIYHPSEDPTNEDLNKLTASSTRDDVRKLPIANSPDLSLEKIHCTTPKISELRNMISEINKPDIPLIPTLLKDKESPKIFSNIGDIIRTENLKSLKEHRLQNGQLSPYLNAHHQYNFSPQPANVSTPHSMPSKIHVKNLETLKEISYENHSDDDDGVEHDEPINLVLDLSKKRVDDEKRGKCDNLPQDLSKKSPAPISQAPMNMGDIFAQQLLKSPTKIDPAALYATQLALCRSSFPAFSSWPGLNINPMIFQSLQAPLMADPQDIKERLQRYQLAGGSVIADNFTERLKSLQNFRNPPGALFGNYKINDINKPELQTDTSNFSPIKKSDDIKPLSLNIESGYNDNFNKLQSPIPPSQAKSEAVIQSPNSVKMVIKNGVLMPKQKQRRYRTERPFTCEHCSARFTLRSNMERHIKQQHPQFWSQRQRGHISNPGRKSQVKNYCDLSIPNYEIPKTHQDFDETKEHYADEKLKFALLAKHLRMNQGECIKKEDDDDCALVIDENDDKADVKTEEPIRSYENPYEKNRILEEKLRKLHSMQIKAEKKNSEETQDLVSVSTLLDNASQQSFKGIFGREEPEVSGASEEDEEGLVASGSTSEGNVSGTDENRSESEAVPVKKKSAYSMAPNRVSCPFCSRKFPWSSSLRRHILTHTGQKPFKCSHCPLLFTTKSNCDRHLLRKHGNNATTISNDVANNNTNYLMRNVPERPFKCSNCPSSTFSTYSNLKKHISCKHSTNAQGDDIKAQGYEAGSSEDEKITNNDHKNEWESQIAHNTKTSVEPALNSVVQNSDLPFKCHLCDGSFGERQDALDHIKDKHFSEFDLLMSKNALDNNATTPDESGHHEDEEHDMRGKFPDYSNRKVICAFCMRRFWSAEDLRRHMRTHTGERPFSCDICRRRFTLKHSMLRHRKKHNVNFDNENANNSDEDVNNFEKFSKADNNNGPTQQQRPGEKTEESDGNEGSDLISNLLGIRDKAFFDKVLTASADDAAKLLGVKNGVKE